ncbi:transcriptional regulator, Crp/Fnr family [Aquipluma nitroreducens]|jgi:CRP/FNR family transcriptional regulator|uniref:Transcriptional regulator, Crp/Fnr family n=1 Tax=Aquipluma nitroreducens TaxID=2010828 RepID=A0A5K7SEI2_9BACT|nr:Crp/Fnr family transcriptional regulator [Aquipluma nitroreducens]BBE19876.1 transcriptional regulator, Crp/Fnr family [Aquipluma nitroreducens]
MLLSETKQEYSWFRRISSQFISEKDFDKLEKTSVKLTFKKGEPILKQGGMPSHVVYLEKGIVKFNYENETSKNLILTIVSAPKILGGANLFYKDNNLFSLIAVEDCEVIMIDSKVIEGVLMDNSKFAMMMFQVASEMFKKSVMNFISLAHKQKEGRIADIILYLAEEVYHSNSFLLSLTRKEIAEFAGCSTENVIMTLSKWQNEKIVSLEGKTIEINDIDKLKYISKIG